MHQPITPIRLHLKYCERCGGLWLRREGVVVVFCAPCAREMAELPGHGRKRRSGRVPGSDDAVVTPGPVPPLEAAADRPPRRGRPSLFLREMAALSACRRIG